MVWSFILIAETLPAVQKGHFPWNQGSVEVGKNNLLIEPKPFFAYHVKIQDK